MDTARLHETGSPALGSELWLLPAEPRSVFGIALVLLPGVCGSGRPRPDGVVVAVVLGVVPQLVPSDHVAAVTGGLDADPIDEIVVAVVHGEHRARQRVGRDRDPTSGTVLDLVVADLHLHARRSPEGGRIEADTVEVAVHQMVLGDEKVAVVRAEENRRPC